MTEEDLIPVVPCCSTIAMMIDVCNIIHLRMVLENGSHYMFGIGSDGGEMPSQVNKKLLPTTITSEFFSEFDQDWKLTTFLGTLQPKDKVSETAMVIADLMVEKFKEFHRTKKNGDPLHIAFSTYFGDTASNEQAAARVLRLGDNLDIPENVFTSLMSFLSDFFFFSHLLHFQSFFFY